MKRHQLIKLLAYSPIAIFLTTLIGASIAAATDTPTEAPAGFTTPTLSGSPGSQSISNGFIDPTGASFAENQAVFEEVDGVDEGLGPVYNAQSCVACHQVPMTGGSSQITVIRAGTRKSGVFTPATVIINGGQDTIPRRSLINQRAICPEAQEHIPADVNTISFRTSLSTLGSGYIEAIDDETIKTIARNQFLGSNGVIKGQVILVPVTEAPGQFRVGRFGWKNQHASLLAMTADAYLNEVGITNRLFPVDKTTVCKTTQDPEDQPDANGIADIDHLTAFMRATMVPPRDDALANTPKALLGKRLFTSIGCAMCHTETIVTAPAGTVINGGTYTIPESLGNKIIHPYSDFLLHNIGTGDGIVHNGPQETAFKLKTAPLWGLRTRLQLMHDGFSLRIDDAIMRHNGEAATIKKKYMRLNSTDKDALLTFLNSL